MVNYCIVFGLSSPNYLGFTKLIPLFTGTRYTEMLYRVGGVGGGYRISLEFYTMI